MALLLHVAALQWFGAPRDPRPQRVDPVRPIEFAVLAVQPAPAVEAAGAPVVARVAEPVAPPRSAAARTDRPAADPAPAPFSWVQPNPAGAPAQALAAPTQDAAATAATIAPVPAAGAPARATAGDLAPVAAGAPSALARIAPEPAGTGEPQWVASVAYLHAPPPPYPPRARRLGIEGTARIVVLIGEDGAVRELRLARSSGDHDLDRAALDAVRGWRFVPARRGERAVPAYAEVPVTFRLTGTP